MQVTTIKLEVSEKAGGVSAELTMPPSPKAILTLAHGAGAGMNHPFMTKLSASLADHKVGSLRFNFPFIEKKKKVVDPPAIAELTISKAVDHIKQNFPGAPVFASGKSFGGRMSSQLASKNPDIGIRGLIFFGFPLHAPNNPSITRAEHLYNIKLPMLFLQGSRDALAYLELMQQVVEKVPKARLEVFEGADHSFKAGKREFIDELAEKASVWCDFFI